ncbi:MAG: urate hydroxylase PuuD [Candidatus Binatia bacterium]|nr:urate hydroxylase PuuD [Candidatus Binatia bacterium]
MEGILFFLRWIHFLAGVTWIGILYYFNFVQTPFFAETEAAVRTGAITKLVPRALWWFRWGAMFTFLAGISMYLIKWHQTGSLFLSQSYGVTITLGGLMGTIMFLNVWLVIWPAQQVVIASANQVAGGGQALPDAAARGRRAALASRTNTVFSIPMLFLMGAASHYSLVGSGGGAPAFWILSLIIIAAVEVNALVGTQGATKKPLDSVSGTLWFGFILTAVFYLLSIGLMS